MFYYFILLKRFYRLAFEGFMALLSRGVYQNAKIDQNWKTKITVVYTNIYTQVLIWIDLVSSQDLNPVSRNLSRIP